MKLPHAAAGHRKKTEFVATIADTGFVVAVALVTEEAHQACVAVYKRQGIIYLPQTTLAEVMYLLTREAGNIVAAHFILTLSATKYRVEPLITEDIQRSGEILQEYADSRVDFVDATIIAVAERRNITEILTLDNRDFRMVRPKHCQYFTILPENQS
jgi:predicted nucleic acid-binding protein